MILQAIDEAPRDGSPVQGYEKDRGLGEIRWQDGSWRDGTGKLVAPTHFQTPPPKPAG